MPEVRGSFASVSRTSSTLKRFASIIVVAIAVIGNQRVTSQPSRPPLQAWGASVQGLRIAVSTTVPPSGAEFLVMLQNTSGADFVINLGYMLANGKHMFPTAVRLRLADRAGNQRELQFFDRRYPVVGGRVDDFVVALRAGATYTFPVSLNDYSNPTTNEFGVTLAAGRHQMSARFEGRGSTNSNSDMQGVALMNFWKGNVESDRLEFEVPSR